MLPQAHRQLASCCFDRRHRARLNCADPPMDPPLCSTCVRILGNKDVRVGHATLCLESQTTVAGTGIVAVTSRTPDASSPYGRTHTTVRGLQVNTGEMPCSTSQRDPAVCRHAVCRPAMRDNFLGWQPGTFLNKKKDGCAYCTAMYPEVERSAIFA